MSGTALNPGAELLHPPVAGWQNQPVQRFHQNYTVRLRKTSHGQASPLNYRGQHTDCLNGCRGEMMGSSASFLQGAGGEDACYCCESEVDACPGPCRQLRRAVGGLCRFLLYLPAPEDGRAVPAPWQKLLLQNSRLQTLSANGGGEQNQLRAENKGKCAGRQPAPMPVLPWLSRAGCAWGSTQRSTCVAVGLPWPEQGREGEPPAKGSPPGTLQGCAAFTGTRQHCRQHGLCPPPACALTPRSCRRRPWV